MRGRAVPADQPEQGIGGRVRLALAKLGGAQKSNVGVPAYLRFVNRRLGGWLAAAGYGLGLTPNHLTAVSAAFSAAAIAALALVEPSGAVAVLVTLSLLLGYAFDSADGQLSRVRGDGKPSGEWLDHVVDVAKTASLHAAVAISLARFADIDDGWLLVPLAYGVVNITFFFGMMLRDQLGGRPSSEGAGAGSTARSVVLLPMDYGTLCLVFLTLAEPMVFLAVYSGLAAVTLAFTARTFIKTYRTLAAA
ncbi:MAG: CDP-alcohol phosphatidyltransferase family protein [Acidimicrobiia bacterium]|nr:CDP-alcohol phosphatidyltransferase family protein [Acidimicrobiia bacterium]